MLRHLPSCCAAAIVAVTSLTSHAQPGNRDVPLPQSMRFCAYWCFTLVQKGDHYDAYRDDSMDGKVASTYRVRSFSRDSVMMDREDTGGNKAVLTGRIAASGNSIEAGKITWVVGANGTVAPYQLTWGDAIGTAIPITLTHGFGGALLAPSSVITPPQDIHFCALNCMTLSLRGDHYTVTSPSPVGLESYRTEWKIERFSPEAVRLRRHFTQTPPGVSRPDTVFSGQVSADGNRLINITQDGNPVGGVMMTWGLSLAQIPGSNQERDKDLRRAGISSPSNDASMLFLLMGLAAFSSMDGDTGSSGSKVPGQALHYACDPSGQQGCNQIPNGATAEEWYKKPE